MAEQEQRIGQEAGQNPQAALMIILSVVAGVEAVILSSTRSVNLREVAEYDFYEQFEEKTVGEGKAAKTELVSYDPPRYAPGYVRAGSDEVNWLKVEPEGASENDIFRRAWQRHAMLTGKLYEIVDAAFPVEQPA